MDGNIASGKEHKLHQVADWRGKKALGETRLSRWQLIVNRNVIIVTALPRGWVWVLNYSSHHWIFWSFPGVDTDELESNIDDWEEETIEFFINEEIIPIGDL